MDAVFADIIGTKREKNTIELYMYAQTIIAARSSLSMQHFRPGNFLNYFAVRLDADGTSVAIMIVAFEFFFLFLSWIFWL